MLCVATMDGALDSKNLLYYCVQLVDCRHRFEKVMKKHEWREKTEEGETRLVTATRHGGKWKLRSRLKSEPEWTEFVKIELDDLETLHEVITNKYQRNRVPHSHVLEIEKLIAAAQPPKKS